MIELNLELAQKFLTENGLQNFQIKKIAGDASFRSYYRIFTQEKNFILSFSPPTHEDVGPLIKRVPNLGYSIASSIILVLSMTDIRLS